MKRYLFLLLFSIIFSILPINAQTFGPHFFSGLDSLPGVETVYLDSTTLQQIISANPPKDAAEYNEMLSGVEKIEILTCADTARQSLLMAFTTNLVKALGMETLVAHNEDNETARIFIRPSAAAKNGPSGLLVEAIEGKEYTLVYIHGDITEKMLNSISFD